MDAKEFTARFYPFHPKLYHVAYTLLNNPDDAEDILQDVYCKLWDRRKELSELRRPEAFCVTLIRNLCIDFLRSPRHRTDDDADAENMLQIGTDATPESELVTDESVRRIEKLICRLPEKQRIVMQMRAYGECTQEEIEVATGESAANVRVLLSRARKTLREWLNA
ncbi:MAG: sigma-70 family RNA polymerase sigma factor [Tannerella sp.]|jgi:RNA polymerase sigma-70 factor (ECF subfamily)|nr:sigma-70 family RNA polymerase sigma factor [Tannerella sp.]